MFTTTASRKVLVPLATLLAAGAVAIGSGATWTSTTDTGVAVTSGNLLHTNSQDGAVLTLDKIVPGDSMSGTVVVTNTGDVDSKLQLDAAVADNNFNGLLQLTITADDDTTDTVDPVAVYPTAAFPSSAVSIQAPFAFAVGDQITYKFTVTLVNDTTLSTVDQNANQGKAAHATFTWIQIQLPGNDSLVENFVPGV